MPGKYLLSLNLIYDCTIVIFRYIVWYFLLFYDHRDKYRGAAFTQRRVYSAIPFHRAAFSQTKSEAREIICRTHTVRNACKYFIDSVVVGIVTAR